MHHLVFIIINCIYLRKIKKAQLYYFLNTNTGTRIELLNNMVQALGNDRREATITDGTETANLEANFPTLQGQSKHWRLNIYFNLNYISNFEIDQDLVAKIHKVNAYITALLPNDNQQVLFFAGSGGTGKSRVINCFTDFARRFCSRTV